MLVMVATWLCWLLSKLSKADTADAIACAEGKQERGEGERERQPPVAGEREVEDNEDANNEVRRLREELRVEREHGARQRAELLRLLAEVGGHQVPGAQRQQQQQQQEDQRQVSAQRQRWAEERRQLEEERLRAAPRPRRRVIAEQILKMMAGASTISGVRGEDHEEENQGKDTRLEGGFPTSFFVVVLTAILLAVLTGMFMCWLGSMLGRRWASSPALEALLEDRGGARGSADSGLRHRLQQTVREGWTAAERADEDEQNQDLKREVRRLREELRVERERSERQAIEHRAQRAEVLRLREDLDGYQVQEVRCREEEQEAHRQREPEEERQERTTLEEQCEAAPRAHAQASHRLRAKARPSVLRPAPDTTGPPAPSRRDDGLRRQRQLEARSDLGSLVHTRFGQCFHVRGCERVAEGFSLVYGRGKHGQLRLRACSYCVTAELQNLVAAEWQGG